MRDRALWILIAGFLLAGCELPFTPGTGGPNAWVDAPLHGSTHPLGPVELVAHGTAPDGVAVVELSIDGAPVTQPSAGGENLYTARLLWTPPGPGTYTFLARARSSGGAWSSGSVVVFTVVLGVAEDKAGIGYSGIGYRTSGVKAIRLSKTDGADAYGPTYENVLNGDYPLGRMLYLNVVKAPNEPLPTLQKEFIKFVLSKQGQRIVVKDGYLPLPAAVAAQQLEVLD